ncbi:MAG: hypothetical protein ABI165_16275, partial [Bryobacteraceae bacterium]
LEKRYTSGLSLLASYTYSHSIDDVGETDSNAQGNGVQNNYDLLRNRGNSTFNIPQVFIASVIYDLPVGKGRKWMNARGPADWVLGGWQVAGIVSGRSGIPFTPVVSTDIANVGNTNHPNRNGSGVLSSGQSINDWFNIADFSIPAAYTYGNSGRAILRGPDLKSLDLKVGKSFQIAETRRLEFRCEMFNFTNTPHFDLPNESVNLPQGGKITGAEAPREIQFGLKFVF